MHVYTDGSMLVNHGGTEMGQGLNTKVAQVVAHELGVPLRARALHRHRHAQGRQHLGHRGLAPAADLNGKAAQDAARQIRERLAAFAAERYGGAPTQVRFADDAVVRRRRTASPSPTLVEQAYLARVQLWSDGFYATPGLHWDRDTLQGRPFFYFAYGAAVSEVVVDTLTGESRSCCAPTCCTTSAAR